MYKADKGFLDRIITGDESWFYYYEPESKSQSKHWKRRDEPVPIKIKAAPSAGKRMATVFEIEKVFYSLTGYQRKPQSIAIIISKN